MEESPMYQFHKLKNMNIDYPTLLLFSFHFKNVKMNSFTFLLLFEKNSFAFDFRLWKDNWYSSKIIF